MHVLGQKLVGHECPLNVLRLAPIAPDLAIKRRVNDKPRMFSVGEEDSCVLLKNWG